MNEYEKEEASNLQKEFEWVLNQEVHKGLDQIHQILVECARRFPVALYGHDNSSKQDKFVLNGPDQLKAFVTLTGDSITSADINFKVTRQTNTTMVHTTIQSEYPWKLQQVQDAANHLQQAIYHIDDVGKHYKFKSSDEVLHIMGNILGSLQRGRTSLIVPRKKTVYDLLKSRNMRSLSPPLPEDLAISFYIQSHKLVLVMYQLMNNQGVMTPDPTPAECSVPWLNEVLVLFTVGLQLCQQLKDKLVLNIPTPQRGTSQSAGLDFFSPRPVFLRPGETQIVGLDIKVVLPPGTWGLLKERSSMACNGVIVLGGVIDADYRGEIMVILHNLSEKEWVIDAHQKICVFSQYKDFTVRSRSNTVVA